MLRISLLVACVSIIGKGWRARRPTMASIEQMSLHDVPASMKEFESDQTKLFARMLFAQNPSFASHRFAQQTFPGVATSPQDLAAWRKVLSCNSVEMSLDEGGADEDIPSDAEGEEIIAEEGRNAESDIKREEIKLSLLKMAASYDRGYGASPSARKRVSQLVHDLESLNPTADAARGVSGDGSQGTPPLQGNWRMIWTTAFDVLSLASSPVVTVGAIHQIIDPPVATNIIDLIPRPQNLLPPEAQPSSIVRAEVKTRTSPRPDSPNRVGLTFEAVKLQPVEVFGLSVPFLPPFSIDLPRVQIPGSTPETSPGYFDVTYLDDDMLIYKQNDPGGFFVLIRVDDYEP